MNKTHRIKVLGLLGLPLLAVALAVMVFAWGSSTDRAEAETPGAAMSMSISPAQDCPAAKDPGDVCVLPGGQFTVTVSADAIPLPAGYVGAQSFLQYGNTGLISKDVAGATALWPDGLAATFLCNDNGTGIGCGALTGLIDPPASFHKGDLVSYGFTCTPGKTQGHVLTLETLGGLNAGTSGNEYAEFEGPNIPAPSSSVTVHCTNENTPTPTSTPPAIPKMQKLPALQNVFLERFDASKIPPPDCLSGQDISDLSEILNRPIITADPKDPNEFQQLAAFEFEVHYDAREVCVEVTIGDAFDAAGASCVTEDSVTKPQLEGVARVGCFTQGKGHGIDDQVALATIKVRPQPEIYSQAKPNQQNGVVVQINNVGCDLSDEQGNAIPLFSCDDADITFRYLEGDVLPNCEVGADDAQAVAFRWGSEVGSLVYSDFMNLEPSGTQSDNDIDINDLQFVFGRFGSSCGDPHPDQDPVNPKA